MKRDREEHSERARLSSSERTRKRPAAAGPLPTHQFRDGGRAAVGTEWPPTAIAVLLDDNHALHGSIVHVNLFTGGSANKLDTDGDAVDNSTGHRVLTGVSTVFFELYVCMYVSMYLCMYVCMYYVFPQ